MKVGEVCLICVHLRLSAADSSHNNDKLKKIGHLLPYFLSASTKTRPVDELGRVTPSNAQIVGAMSAGVAAS